MTQQLNYAVFGVGRIGRVHAAIVAEQGHPIVAIGDEADGAIDLTRHVLNQLPHQPHHRWLQSSVPVLQRWRHERDRCAQPQKLRS